MGVSYMKVRADGCKFWRPIWAFAIKDIKIFLSNRTEATLSPQLLLISSRATLKEALTAKRAEVPC